MRSWLYGLIAVAGVAAGAGQGQAGMAVYTSRAAFEAAVAGVTRQDFSAARVADGQAAWSPGPCRPRPTTPSSSRGTSPPA